ncbi:unnamed protein product [Diatraea saccharalis]|uniref:Uncharacterized protein n=1 Tax=Diatraea saccharalis TaxID=40085 RepID=A0A9N9RC51_9NEOP|nr:unnamed protein product [Diatraea saccharalis]
MYYVIADNPNIGYVSINKEPESYSIRYSLKPRRYMGISGVQSFKKIKEEKRSEYMKKINKQKQQEAFDERIPVYKFNQRSTETPRPVKDETKYNHDEINTRVSRAKNVNSNNSHQRNQPNVENRRGQRVNKMNIHDNKVDTLQVNVRKLDIASEPQRVRISNKHQHSTLYTQMRDDNHMRIPTSMLVDKTFQNGANFKDKNAQIMTRILDDMSQKITDRRMKTNEYKKRDTDNAYGKPRRNSISDKMRKYIGNDVNMLQKREPIKTARIGSHEEEFQDSEPYALFYRNGPETIENQAGLTW